MRTEKRKDDMATLGFTHQNVQQPELSNWQISHFITNQQQAVNYFIKNKAGEGYAALFLNTQGGLLRHQVYLQHSCELQLIVDEAKRLKAKKVFIALHRQGRCRRFFKDVAMAQLIIQTATALHKRKVLFGDYLEICGNNVTSAMATHGNLFIH